MHGAKASSCWGLDAEALMRRNPAASHAPPTPLVVKAGDSCAWPCGCRRQRRAAVRRGGLLARIQYAPVIVNTTIFMPRATVDAGRGAATPARSGSGRATDGRGSRESARSHQAEPVVCPRKHMTDRPARRKLYLRHRRTAHRFAPPCIPSRLQRVGGKTSSTSRVYDVYFRASRCP